MQHEDGFCDECGCECEHAWLSFDGAERCEDCARRMMVPQVRVASKPEARDDGR